MIDTILFDLDGTLLPMDQDAFTEYYFKLLAGKMAPLGYEPKQLIAAVWDGTKAMVKNDGTCKNEKAFWTRFTQLYGEKALQDQASFESFYENEFAQAKQEQCLMVGNDADEDLIAEKTGMQVFLLTDCLINRTGKDLSGYAQGGFEKLRAYIKGME